MSGGFIQTVLGGIGTGSIYALIGMSFALVFGKLRICSYLHGDLAILAAYLVFWAFSLFKIDPFITVIVLVPVFFVLGYLVQKFFMKPFMSMAVWQGRYQAQVMVTWGIGMVLMALEFIFWSGTYRNTGVSYRNSVISFGEVKLLVTHLLAIITLLVIFFGLNLLLRKTNLGISLRACSDDRKTAMLTGINYQRVCALTFGLSAAIAVIAGMFYTLTSSISPAIGIELTFKGWVAVIIGGMGSLGGVILAGILVGLIESLTSYLWIPALNQATVFAFLLILLIFKPSGLFSKSKV